MSSNHINIIGAGLAGALMAAILAKKGYQVRVYERRPDMRKTDISAGRSINLALSVRGLHALEEAGLKEDILELAIPMPGRMIHDTAGELDFQPYSKDPNHYINSISRGELNCRLMDKSESLKRVDYFFEHRCLEMDFDTGEIVIQNEQTGEVFSEKGLATIAADGAFSAVRYAMQKTPRFNFSQDFLDHGYKELTIPPGPNDTYLMEPNALHIWPRGQYMVIALPNLDKSFTVTLFLPYEGEYSFERLQTPAAVRQFFETQFPDAVPLMPTLEEDFFDNPTGSLVTVRCFPWAIGEKVALLGDAAHAIVPFFGQGMNAAFEDCSILSECIDGADGDWEKAFSAYQISRKVNADAIAQMALENYIEMRDKVADDRFVFHKQVEHMLERSHSTYKSRYEMVSFTRIPYAEAYRRGELNQQILERITDGVTSIEDIDMEMADRVIEEVLGDLN